MSRSARAAAAFSFAEACLSKKRGRPRKTSVSRFPGGKIRSDGGTEHGAMQREAQIDLASATRSLTAITIPEAARTRQEQDIVLAMIARSRETNLGFLCGIAFKRGLFQWLDCRTCGQAGLSL